MRRVIGEMWDVMVCVKGWARPRCRLWLSFISFRSFKVIIFNGVVAIS